MEEPFSFKSNNSQPRPFVEDLQRELEEERMKEMIARKSSTIQ